MNQTKKNYLGNVMYQILTLIIPFIVTPYVSRVIGAEGIGIFSYTHSIVYYFMLATLLGVNNYGNRTVAKVRDNKEELSKKFCGIYYFQLFTGIVLYIIYTLYVIIFCKDYKDIFFIQSLNIISSILDITWLFFGLEKFKTIILRNTVIKTISVVLIFTLGKSINDLWIYTLIMAGTTMLSQLVLWTNVRKYISIKRIDIQEIKKHIKPNATLFIPVIAISLYKVMDKIMLGAMASVTEVGYYTNAEKTMNVPLTVITSLGTVMLPKISNLVQKGNKDEINRYIEKSIKFVMFLSLAMCMGTIGIAKDFSNLYFGDGFEKSGIIMMYLAITLPFLSFANV